MSDSIAIKLNLYEINGSMPPDPEHHGYRQNVSAIVVTVGVENAIKLAALTYPGIEVHQALRRDRAAKLILDPTFFGDLS